MCDITGGLSCRGECRKNDIFNIFTHLSRSTDCTVQRASMAIVLCSMHQCLLYCAVYLNGDYTVQRTSVVIIQCSVHQW